jgi:hypothetical protein
MYERHHSMQNLQQHAEDEHGRPLATKPAFLACMNATIRCRICINIRFFFSCSLYDARTIRDFVMVLIANQSNHRKPDGFDDI